MPAEQFDIEVVWGIGDAGTALGAFDQALASANAHNYNLVTLSSVIPKGARVTEPGQLAPGRWDVGDMVAVVLARNTGTEPGEVIAAGLGWHQAAEGGVFMECAGSTKAECEHELERNLADARATRDWDWQPEPRTRVVETTVEDVGAVVCVAVYRPIPER
jgi:arginine decarboxylase